MSDSNMIIADSYKRDIQIAIKKLAASKQERVYLEHPSVGEYVCCEKPQESEYVIVGGSYDLKTLGLSEESKIVYHVVNNPMGPAN